MFVAGQLKAQGEGVKPAGFNVELVPFSLQVAGRIGRFGGDRLSVKKNLNLIRGLNLKGDGGRSCDSLRTLVGVEHSAEPGDDVTPAEEDAQKQDAHAGEGSQSYEGQIVVHV